MTVTVLLLAGCDIPQDPNQTTEEISKSKTMRVGIVENEPWVTDTSMPDGVEVRLVQDFARTLGARAQWYPMAEQEALRALAAGQLNLVIGGLTKSTPSKGTGFTRPYFTARYSIGWPHAGQNDLGDQLVAIWPASWLAKKVLAKGGRPVESEAPFRTGYPVADADWKLAGRGYYPDIELYKEEHVMAVQQGENRFLVTLESFLDAHQKDVSYLIGEFTR